MELIRRLAVGLALAPLAGAAVASSDARVEALLAAGRAPAGVVFEIVSGDARALEWAVPRVAGYAERLRSRYPGLPIAVVTHGNEQFALRADAAPGFAALHAQVQRLRRQDNVDVHVCGAYAEMRGVPPEAFPGYVDVAPTGPHQIQDYRELGYELVKVTRP